MLSVLSFNTASFNPEQALWQSLWWDEKNDCSLFDFRDVQLRHILGVIKDCQPDVLCLQESVILPSRGHLVRTSSFTSSSSSSDSSKTDNDNNDEQGEFRSKLSGKPPTFSLDDAPHSDADPSGERRQKETASGHQGSPKRRAFVELVNKMGYIFIGSTATHADHTCLYVKERRENKDAFSIELLPSPKHLRCVGGQEGGDSYNFPCCVLRVTTATTNNVANSCTASPNAALIAVASVHLSPFSSGGGGAGSSRKRGIFANSGETRRDAQIRRTLSGLYAALEEQVASPGNAGITRCAVLVAGDFNIQQGERRCRAADLLGCSDVHDVLRERILLSGDDNASLQCGMCDSFALPESKWLDDSDRRDGDDAEKTLRKIMAVSAPEMWTWNSTKAANRFNGGGSEFTARLDRVVFRSFSLASPSGSKSSGEGSDNSGLVRVRQLQLRREAARCSLSVGDDTSSSLLQSDTDEEDEEHDDDDSTRKRETASELPPVTTTGAIAEWLKPVLLRLVAHKPVKDSELDRIDAEAYAKHMEQRRERQLNSGSGKPASVSLIAEDGDEPKFFFDDAADDDERNEHAGPVPEGGRNRYLSDHYGIHSKILVRLQ